MRLTIIWEPAAAAGLRRLKSRDGDAVKPLVQGSTPSLSNPSRPRAASWAAPICGGYG
nr:hypothetical protein [Streptomyces phaeochromogenes]